MAVSDLHVIVGLGASGLSCVRYLKNKQIPIAVMDTRAEPPNLAAFKADYPDVPLSLGCWDEALLNKAACIVLSPGVSLKEPAIAAQVTRGIPVIGDIELFAQAVTAPVIAITGTNAKSTVTTLVGQMMQAAGYQAAVGGNLGVPALDLLQTHSKADVFVLELSSFQLETTFSLQAQVATVLNVTPDHMDRYATLADYQAAKHRVYHQCRLAVCNRDDPLTDTTVTPRYYFTMRVPGKDEFGLIEHQKEVYLAFGSERLLPVRELPMVGKHDQANALAALAIGHGFGLSFDVMLRALQAFKGLPHRCQWVRERSGVSWYNDSKGTNVGATQAAIEGLGSILDGKIILIAGGVGKNADFHSLVPAIKEYVRHVVLIGKAAKEMAEIFAEHVPVSFAKTMDEAVQMAGEAALPGDSVLLSPACASFDMFKHFEHRGDVFTQLVEAL